MNPFAARASAAELARLLDEPAVAGGRPGTPAALAALAHRVAEVAPALEPGGAVRPEFRDALRTRLLAVATVQAAADEAPAAAPVRSPRAAWRGAALAGGMASVVAVSGVAVASEQALPGDAFYGLKRTSESARLALSFGPAAEGQTHLRHASTRLDEVAGLVGVPASALGVLGTEPGALAAGLDAGPDADLVTGALADMDASTRSGGDALARAAADGDEASLRLLEDWSQEQAAELSGLLPELPEAARLRAQVSLAVVASVAEQVLGEDVVEVPAPVVVAPVPVPAPDAPTAVPTPSATVAVPPAAPVPVEPTPAPGSPAASPDAPAPRASEPATRPDPEPTAPGVPAPPAPEPTLPTPPLPTLPLPTLPLPTLPAPPAPLPTLAPAPVPPPTLPLPPVPTLPDLPLPLPALPAPVPGLIG